ncbi:MAG TPA: T9SS type A sorting domain-containing protein, partial [Saprospiraceae bacterium]|nr:T9SS type A sorting domain-containing protein [Saprospiraceae bacterium]
GNFQSSGDKTVVSHVSGEVVIASNREISSNKPLLYPNPGSSEIIVDFENHVNPDGIVYFYNSTGSEIYRTTMNQGKIEVPTIPSGMYWLKLQAGAETYLERWIKI